MFSSLPNQMPAGFGLVQSIGTRVAKVPTGQGRENLTPQRGPEGEGFLREFASAQTKQADGTDGAETSDGKDLIEGGIATPSPDAEHAEDAEPDKAGSTDTPSETYSADTETENGIGLAGNADDAIPRAGPSATPAQPLAPHAAAAAVVLRAESPQEISQILGQGMAVSSESEQRVEFASEQGFAAAGSADDLGAQVTRRVQPQAGALPVAALSRQGSETPSVPAPQFGPGEVVPATVTEGKPAGPAEQRPGGASGSFDALGPVNSALNTSGRPPPDTERPVDHARAEGSRNSPAISTTRPNGDASKMTQAPSGVAPNGVKMADTPPAFDQIDWREDAKLVSEIPAGAELPGYGPASSRFAADLTTAHPVVSQRPEMPRHVALQIADAVQRNSGKSIDLVLSPEELGRVRISLTTASSGMAVSIIAERPETLDLLRRHIDVLAQDFHDLGYETAEFSFGRDNAGPGSDGTRTGGQANAAGFDTEPLAPAPIQIATDRVDIRL